MEPGGYDQRESAEFYGSRAPYMPLATRADILVFQTNPLNEAVEATGPISVQLWISSSALDTDFTAKLLDIYPPSPDYPEGYALNLTDGILRAKFHSSWSEPELLEPGKIYPITVRLYPTSNLFAKGHRIRLEITSSDFPNHDRNHNTGKDDLTDTELVVAHQRIVHGPHYSSRLALPVNRNA